MLDRSCFRNAARTLLAVVSFAVLAGRAHAHHPMGGKSPATFVEGLLSGIGHPVIGPDHLAFIVAIGIAAALVPSGVGIIAAFIATSTLGVLLHGVALGIPLVEHVVSLSVVAAGALIASGRNTPRSLWLLLAAAVGLFHGYAFGEAVIGADRSVVGAYLIGIAIISSLIAWACKAVTAHVRAADGIGARHVRTAGALLACIGVVMFAGGLVQA